MQRGLYRLTALILLCCTLLGCGSPTFVYNRLDHLLSWYVNDYADLNRDQEEFLDTRLEPFLDWHRSAELPCYNLLLDDIATTLDREVTSKDMIRLSNEFETAWLRTQSEALDWLLELGAELSDEQIEEFIAELRERQRKDRKKFVKRSREDFLEDSYDNFADSAKDYLGRLQPEQRTAMRAAVERLQRADELWMEERRGFVTDLESLLSREAGWQPRVRDLVATRSDNAPEEYQRILEHNVAVLQEATAELLNSRTEKQDKKLRKRVASLRTDLYKLASAASEPASCEAPV